MEKAIDEARNTTQDADDDAANASKDAKDESEKTFNVNVEEGEQVKGNGEEEENSRTKELDDSYAKLAQYSQFIKASLLTDLQLSEGVLEGEEDLEDELQAEVDNLVLKFAGNLSRALEETRDLANERTAQSDDSGDFSLNGSNDLGLAASFPSTRDGGVDGSSVLLDSFDGVLQTSVDRVFGALLDVYIDTNSRLIDIDVGKVTGLDVYTKAKARFVDIDVGKVVNNGNAEGRGSRKERRESYEAEVGETHVDDWVSNNKSIP